MRRPARPLAINRRFPFRSGLFAFRYVARYFIGLDIGEASADQQRQCAGVGHCITAATINSVTTKAEMLISSMKV